MTTYIDFQKKIYSLLTGDPALVAKVTGVFDMVPEEQLGPYIVIDTIQALEGSLVDDTERQISVDLHIWSSYRGKKEVLEISELIEAALPADLRTENLIVLQDQSDWYHGIFTIRGYVRRV